MNKVVVLGESDNVGTCLAQVDAGTAVEVPPGTGNTLVVNDDVPFGHKIAIKDIPAGADVLKYGEVIGRASSDIERGAWVHIHNIESVRARGDLG